MQVIEISMYTWELTFLSDPKYSKGSSEDEVDKKRFTNVYDINSSKLSYYYYELYMNLKMKKKLGVSVKINEQKN